MAGFGEVFWMNDLLISHYVASFREVDADVIAEVQVQIRRDENDIDGDHLQVRVRLPAAAASKPFAELQQIAVTQALQLLSDAGRSLPEKVE
jgi:hypothetical protein